MLAFDRFNRHPSDALRVETEPPSTTAPNFDVRAIRTAGLGDTTYLLSYNGNGIVVDPQRDIERFLDQADAQGLRIRYVLETHVHNDYVSGVASSPAAHRRSWFCRLARASRSTTRRRSTSKTWWAKAWWCGRSTHPATHRST